MCGSSLQPLTLLLCRVKTGHEGKVGLDVWTHIGSLSSFVVCTLFSFACSKDFDRSFPHLDS